MRRAVQRALFASAMLLACGGGQTGTSVFSTSWDDDGGKSIEAVRLRLAGRTIPAGVDVAIGVAGHSGKILGQPLAGGARWSFAHPLDARPLVAGGVVVASGGGDVFALDALTGKLLWTRPTGGLPLHGVGDDGTVTVLTFGSPTGAPGNSTLLAVGHDGAVLRQVERPVDFGVPAVVDRLAFVPWEHQYVSVLDVTNGTEVGRVVLREKSSHAWTVGGGLYFGELGLFRFDDKIKDASKGGADHLGLPAKELPGRPVLMRPGEEAKKPIAGAPDKIRLYVRPTPPNEPLAMDSGRFYATYFRLALGFQGTSGQVAWVHTHGPAFIGGAVAAGGLVLCDADGKVTTLDAQTGGEVGQALDLGEPLEACTVQVDAFHKTGAVKDPGTLIQQTRVALLDRDLELDAGQTLLLRQIGTFPDQTGTDLLLELATNPRTPPGLLEEVRTALASRRTGAHVLARALARHYDFLHDVLSPPPVGPIARALSAMKATEGNAALASHLLDPANTDKDVRDVAQALDVLATPAETPALLEFLALYRDAPAVPEEIPDAVNAVGEALLRVGGAPGKAAVADAIKHYGTNPLVRARLSALVDAQQAVKP